MFRMYVLNICVRGPVREKPRARGPGVFSLTPLITAMLGHKSYHTHKREKRKRAEGIYWLRVAMRPF